MAKVDEKQEAIARVYSRAMLDLAESQGEVVSLYEELRDLIGLLEERGDFRRVMTSRLVDAGERERFLEKTLRSRASDLLVNSLQVINRHGRMDLLETILTLYRSEYQDRHGKIDVHVTTAVPLDDALRRELEAVAQRLVGREPHLVEEVDPTLVGGLVMRVGDKKIDTSVATRVRNLRRALLERAGEEIHLSRFAAAG